MDNEYYLDKKNDIFFINRKIMFFGIYGVVIVIFDLH
jgi:hypothetical protein